MSAMEVMVNWSYTTAKAKPGDDERSHLSIKMTFADENKCSQGPDKRDLHDIDDDTNGCEIYCWRKVIQAKVEGPKAKNRTARFKIDITRNLTHELVLCTFHRIH